MPPKASRGVIQSAADARVPSQNRRPGPPRPRRSRRTFSLRTTAQTASRGDMEIGEADAAGGGSGAPIVHRRQIGQSSVDDLFDCLRGVWNRLEALPPSAVAALTSKLDALRPEDFGLCRDEADRLMGTGSRVGYQEVYSGSEITLCIFVLKAGAHIPLHDHPKMQVFGRLLFGRVRVRSYNPEPLDPVADDLRPLPPGACATVLHEDNVLGPTPETFMLGPSEGNVHELYALEDSAFFDIVVPPYDAAQGRGCTYYALMGGGMGTDQRPILVPSDSGDFSTEPLRYGGPRFEPPSAFLGGAARGAADQASREDQRW